MTKGEAGTEATGADSVQHSEETAAKSGVLRPGRGLSVMLVLLDTPI